MTKQTIVLATHLASLLFLITGCETVEKITPTNKAAILEIAVINEELNAVPGALVQIFTSEEEWKKPDGIPLTSGTTNPQGSITFGNLPSQILWFKIDKLDESSYYKYQSYTWYHNRNRDNQLHEKLTSQAKTSIKIRVESAVVKSVVIKKCEISFTPQYFNRNWDIAEEYTYISSSSNKEIPLTDASGAACDLYCSLTDYSISSSPSYKSSLTQYTNVKAENGPFLFMPDFTCYNLSRNITISFYDHEFLDSYKAMKEYELTNQINSGYYDEISLLSLPSFTFRLLDIARQSGFASEIELAGNKGNYTFKLFLEWKNQ
jgi:hypothetical protein